jgi:ATP-binding cassette, subfamily B, bacterial
MAPPRPLFVPAGRGLAEPGKSWRDRLQALRHVPRLFKLVWETHRGYTLAIMALRGLRAAIPIAVLWIGKLIIDAVIQSVQVAGAGGAVNWKHLAGLVAIELGIAVVGEGLARVSSLYESLLGDLFANRTSVQLMQHAASLDLEQFEDAETYDRLERARRQTVGRIGLFTQLLATIQDLITLISLSVALVVYVPWLILLLAISVLPSFLGESHFASMGYSLLYSWTPQRRLLDYLRYAGASDVTAKEVKLFGLSPFLVDRYASLSDEFYQANKQLAVKRSVVSGLLAVVGTLGYYSAYGVIVYLTIRGHRSAAGPFTIGVLTFLAASFRQSRDLIQRVLLSITQIYEQSLYLDDLFSFFTLEPRIKSAPGALPVPRPIRQGFTFEDVGFKYPNGEAWAVRNLSFTLPAGERLALVGENGAGKTTLAKLLARLYDPTEGRILLDGIDLREYDVESLRQNVGVIFQDFVRYDMNVRENIAVGDIAELENEPAITVAADRSLATQVISRLPAGLDQMLGRRFESAVDLSGGEWQKVALARAYLRDAQLLILDEPTAALDARAEYEVFLRFSELTAGKMAVLISHRFSTVRMADRIVVLQGGRLVEEGTHESLLAKGGLYAELFSLQARGYQ